MKRAWQICGWMLFKVFVLETGPSWLAGIAIDVDDHRGGLRQLGTCGQERGFGDLCCCRYLMTFVSDGGEAGDVHSEVSGVNGKSGLAVGLPSRGDG